MIPIDLIHEILLRLPAKSAARFRCVSKLWLSITTRPDFIGSFTSQHSSTRLCLLVCVKKGEKRLFNSIPQLEHPDKTFNPYVESYEISAPRYDCYEGSEQSVHGLICLRDFDGNIVVWNPTTRQHVHLPKPQPNFIVVSSFLGYDPVEHKYKVLCIPVRLRYQDPLVFTLGPQESWRVPQNSLYHDSIRTSGIKGICINGHVYYEASIRLKVDGTLKTEGIVMSFDVRYEKFNVIKKPADDELGNLFINYKGKLAWVCSGSYCIRFWVLEDKEKQKWWPRKFRLSLPRIPLGGPNRCCRVSSWRLRGVTHDGCEFIYTDQTSSQAFYVLYYDPERNSTRRITYREKETVFSCYQKKKETVFRCDYTKEKYTHYYPNHCESLMSLKF